MGEVVTPAFGRRKAALTGFIPEGLGMDALDRKPTDCGEHLDRLSDCIAAERRRAELIAFAKTGAPKCPGCVRLVCRDCQNLA